MAELRQDYLTGQWVAIAEERARRPILHKMPAGVEESDKSLCPFCPENKHMTPKETFINGHVRVIPNLYPALCAESSHGFGFHEVIVDTPKHNLRLENFSVNEICRILQTISDRMEYFYKDQRIKYVQVFKNQGFEAGASILHSHWQLLAMPIVPSKILTIGSNFHRYFKDNGSCYLCELLSGKNNLTVLEDESVAVYVPFAAHYPYCVNIAPKKHYSDIWSVDDKTIEGLASALKKTVKTLNDVYEGLAYNICFYGAGSDNPGWHFHMQLVPRRHNFAGFEIGTGCFINSVPPERAASRLRGLIHEKDSF